MKREDAILKMAGESVKLEKVSKAIEKVRLWFLSDDSNGKGNYDDYRRVMDAISSVNMAAHALDVTIRSMRADDECNRSMHYTSNNIKGEQE